MAPPERMVGTVLPFHQHNGQERPRKVERRMIYMVSPLAGSMELTIISHARFIQGICLNNAKVRTPQQQVHPTSLGPIPNMVKAILPCMKLTQAYQAMGTGNIPTKLRLNTMSPKLVNSVPGMTEKWCCTACIVLAEQRPQEQVWWPIA